MTHEHMRLIGGFATGTLSEGQRKLLFEAALEDQELFDELARDQALKELLEAPGVRQRLIASIQTNPQTTPWWIHPLPWAMAGAALSVSAGLFLLVFLTPSGSRPRSQTSEVARANPPATPPVVAESPSAQSDTQPTPKIQNEPKPSPAARPPATTSPAAPPPELQNEPKPGSAGQTAAEPQKPASAAPPGTPLPVRALAMRPVVPIGRFAFDYSIHDGVLRIVPGSDGYLLVRAIVGPIDRLMLPTAHLVQARPAELRVPDGATSMLVLFSARPVQEDSTDDLAMRATPRTEASGTVEDPRPSVNSRLEVRIVVDGK